MVMPTKWTVLDGSLAAGDVALAEGKILIGNSSGVAAALDMGATAGNMLVDSGTTGVSVAMSGDTTMTSTGAVTIGADKVTESKVADGAGVSALHVAKYAYALYDFSTDGGGAPGAVTLTSACTIPDNACVTLDSYDVLTTCTSAGDTGTLKVGLATDGDLSTAIAINDGTNPWDSGMHFGSAATPLAVKTTGARLIVVTTATQAFTAGKIVFCFRYYVTV